MNQIQITNQFDEYKEQGIDAAVAEVQYLNRLSTR